MSVVAAVAEAAVEADEELLESASPRGHGFSAAFTWRFSSASLCSTLSVSRRISSSYFWLMFISKWYLLSRAFVKKINFKFLHNFEALLFSVFFFKYF
jgi:hypothetical protein